MNTDKSNRWLWTTALVLASAATGAALTILFMALVAVPQ